MDIIPIKYVHDSLLVLDQTRLPNEVVWFSISTRDELYEAIKSLRVRGAPAIGVAAALGIAICAREYAEEEFTSFYEHFCEDKTYINSSRPTAVNLSWALERMAACVRNCKDLPVSEIKKVLLAEATAVRQEDEDGCRMLGEHGLTLLRPGMGILTHCNAGALATARYGTALSPLYIGHEQGYDFKVYADETRPLLQGARLTAFELSEAGIDVTLICDNMASLVMKQGRIDAVLVGCDRMAANGDGANKIGTSALAILTKEYDIPFYMFVPTSTIDLATSDGSGIEIELRPGSEITDLWYEKPMAPAGIKTYNPAFDVTEAKYITAVVTEQGIARPPYTESLKIMIDKANAK